MDHPTGVYSIGDSATGFQYTGDHPGRDLRSVDLDSLAFGVAVEDVLRVMHVAVSRGGQHTPNNIRTIMYILLNFSCVAIANPTDYEQ